MLELSVHWRIENRVFFSMVMQNWPMLDFLSPSGIEAHHKTNLWRNCECKHKLGRSRTIIADLNHEVHAPWKSSLNHTNVIASRVVRMQLHYKHEIKMFSSSSLLSPFFWKMYVFTFHPFIFYITNDNVAK